MIRSTSEPSDDLEGFGYAWADADTLMVLGNAAGAPNALLLQSCEIPTGSCEQLTTFTDATQVFAVGDSDLLWGLMADPEVVFSSGPAEQAESANTEIPE